MRDMFNVEHVPKNPAAVLSKVRGCLPFLPQCSAHLQKYMYEGDKFLGKGPATEKISFIMQVPAMNRDLQCPEFIQSMTCEYELNTYVYTLCEGLICHVRVQGKGELQSRKWWSRQICQTST
jgi:hypothetical protein